MMTNSCFFGAICGTRADYFALIETCKANGIEPYRYLVALCKALPLAKTVDDYEALLPWNIVFNPR